MTDKMDIAADLVRKARKLAMRQDVLDAERKALTADLLALGWESGKVMTKAGSFTVSAVNTYPEPEILAALTPGQAARCQKKVLDRAKVRALYPAAFDAAKVENGQKVTFN